ncbi:MAG TPA: MarC family protein [Candidatus Binatia bacterium]
MYDFGPAVVFTIFFVTLGPLKILAPFAQRTHDLDNAAMRQISVRAFVIATISIVVGSLIGSVLLQNWRISVDTMIIAAGVIFFLVALRVLLEQYEPPHAAAPAAPLPNDPTAAAIRLLFPIVLTPYGIAAVIVLLANSNDAQRTLMILALVVLVMVLNLGAMLYARKILVGVTMIVLQVVGAVLGVLQVALAIQFMITGLQRLGVIRG